MLQTRTLCSTMWRMSRRRRIWRTIARGLQQRLGSLPLRRACQSKFSRTCAYVETAITPSSSSPGSLAGWSLCGIPIDFITSGMEVVPAETTGDLIYSLITDSIVRYFLFPPRRTSYLILFLYWNMLNYKPCNLAGNTISVTMSMIMSNLVDLTPGANLHLSYNSQLSNRDNRIIVIIQLYLKFSRSFKDCNSCFERLFLFIR